MKFSRIFIKIILLSVLFVLPNIESTSANFTDTEVISSNSVTVGEFNTEPEPYVDLIYPETEQHFRVGDEVEILWEATSTGHLPDNSLFITIYTVQEGTNFELDIRDITLNTGSVIWEVPEDLENTRIKVVLWGYSFDTGWYVIDESDEYSNIYSTTTDDVVLNEILPNPLGDDSAEMPDGEWVELYNKSDTNSYYLKDWYLQDESGKILEITTENTHDNSFVIAPNGFKVVYLNGEYSGWLNNTGDTVYLYDQFDGLKDAQTFTETPENKSIARIPDGTGPWIDPIPTPGEKNVATDEELEETEELVQPEESTEVVEEIQETEAQEEVIEDIVNTDEIPQETLQSDEVEKVEEPDKIEDINLQEVIKEEEPQIEEDVEETAEESTDTDILLPEESLNTEAILKEEETDEDI